MEDSLEAIFNSQRCKHSKSSSIQNKKIVLDDSSTGGSSCLKKAVSVCSEASSPEHKFNKQEFFNQFRVPVTLDLSQCSSQQFDQFEEETLQKQKLEFTERNAVKFIDSSVLNQRLQFEENNPQESLLRLYDCRFPFEFQGGHIVNACNLSNPLEIEEHFFGNHSPLKSRQTPILVFYCEFSEKRSVKIYHHIRNRDRCLNDYPNLHYPDMYVLDKGFAGYFSENRQNCQGGYVKMNDKTREQEYQQQLQLHTEQWRQVTRKKM